MIDGGPGDDHLVGGGGADAIDGGQGSDGCEGAKGRTDLLRQGSAAEGLRLRPARTRRPAAAPACRSIGGGGRDQFVVAFDEASQTFSVTAKKGLAIGPGCSHAPDSTPTVSCPANGPAAG